MQLHGLLLQVFLGQLAGALPFHYSRKQPELQMFRATMELEKN